MKCLNLHLRPHSKGQTPQKGYRKAMLYEG